MDERGEYGELDGENTMPPQLGSSVLSKSKRILIDFVMVIDEFYLKTSTIKTLTQQTLLKNIEKNKAKKE